ncbi:MAG TPA: tetratricopeptide repeat protein [Pirellulales bacterium]|jgi:tetratricopeptide (TPR) repeat protein|nr:tetratricopeptide repeat protein [Pirellulales bacterium]
MATTSEAFQTALAHHQAGQLREAEAIYRQILGVEPSHADSLHLLGVMAHQMNRHDVAIEYIRRAIELRGDQPMYYSNLGEAFRSLGNLAEAAACQRAALKADPNYSQAHNNLGNVLKSLGQTAEAIAAFDRAIQLQPGYAEPHNNLAAILQEQGDLPAAIAHYRQAVAINPRYAGAYKNLSTALRSQGKLAEAAECCQQALQLAPLDSEAHLNLGTVYQAQQKYEEALASYREAIRLDPRCALAYNNSGAALKERKQYEAASECYRRAVELRPDFAEAFNNWGALCLEQKQFDLAVARFRKALDLRPHSADTLANLGTALQMQGKPAESIVYHRRALAIQPDRHHTHFSLGAAFHFLGQSEAALASYGEAIRLQPDYAEAYYNRSLVRFQLGDLAAGWLDHEWRLKCKGSQGGRFDAPKWDGSLLAGRTLLVHAEQGLGDTLQFIRYLRRAQAWGGEVVAEVQAGLIPLLRGSGFGPLVGRGSALPRFDVQIPLLSLPGLFQTTLETVPAEIPYLAADPNLTAKWHERLESYDGFKVGIAWQGSPAYAEDHYRSMPLSWFGVLAQVPGVRLFSLQIGPGSEQIGMLDGRFPVVDFASGADSEGGAFMDTAAIMRNLDLVITADTAIVHLAGGLGVPVWVAQPIPPDWRWLIHSETSPWYPSLRLFRQTELGSWQPVFDRLADALRAIV